MTLVQKQNRDYSAALQNAKQTSHIPLDMDLPEQLELFDENNSKEWKFYNKRDRTRANSRKIRRYFLFHQQSNSIVLVKGR